MVATRPVDFRKCADGLAALVCDRRCVRSVLGDDLCVPGPGLCHRRPTWSGVDPPGVVYALAPDRKAERPIAHLAASGAYCKSTIMAATVSSPRMRRRRTCLLLVACPPAPLRARRGSAPIASEALERIAGLYQIETEIRGFSADHRRGPPRKEPADHRGSRTVAAREARPDQSEDQTCRGDPLRALAMGRAHPLLR